MLKNVIIYGILGGIIACVYIYFLDYTNIIYKGPYGSVLGYVAIVIMPLITFFALRKIYRENTGSDFRFLELWAAGILVSLTAAVAYSFLSFLYTHYLVNDYPEKMANLEALYLRNSGKSETEVLKRADLVREHYRSFRPYLNTLIWYAVSGVVYSLLSLVILKGMSKKKGEEKLQNA